MKCYHPTDGFSFVRRYGIALLAAAGAIVVRLALMPLLGTRPPYITFYLGTVIAAAFGGMGPGLLVTCIGVVFGLIVLPEGPVVIEQEAVRLGLYVLSGVGICLIAEGMHRQRRKVQEQAQELQRAHDELELLIRERTEELRRKELLLERQSRQAAMGEMINNIAHQWRQPLNSLGLIIQTLAMVNNTGEIRQITLQDPVGKAMDIIRHMSQTIDDFRDYFKPEKDRVPFHATQVVAKTMKLTEDHFKALNIETEIIAPADPVIVGYPNQFGQVLLNILLNARDAAVERNVPSPRIVITIGTESEKAVITIADNAGGIPADIVGRLFEPYFTTKAPDKGTGIGLFMSKTIIEKTMGGKLAVRNIENGAEFRIELEPISPRTA